MERDSVKKATSFISAPQFGQVNGSAEYTLWISRAQVGEAEGDFARGFRSWLPAARVRLA
jgi:hypothetical protein